jgi:hypothetical protein
MTERRDHNGNATNQPRKVFAWAASSSACWRCCPALLRRARLVRQPAPPLHCLTTPFTTPTPARGDSSPQVTDAGAPAAASPSCFIRPRAASGLPRPTTAAWTSPLTAGWPWATGPSTSTSPTSTASPAAAAWTSCWRWGRWCSRKTAAIGAAGAAWESWRCWGPAGLGCTCAAQPGLSWRLARRAAVHMGCGRSLQVR